MKFSQKETARMQHFFNSRGFYCGVEDGIVGAATRLAIRKYQKSYGLLEDGIIGSNTFKKMKSDGFSLECESTPIVDHTNIDVDVPDEISESAFDLIVEFEVGGKAGYDPRPEWPEGQSGVTIGIGYDLGTCKKQKILTDWAALDTETLSRLAECSGVQGYPASLYIRNLKDVRIPYELAMVVFCNSTLPEEIKKTKTVFEGAFDKLSKDAFGALVSLVYNRGTSTKGPKRTEMLEIRKACLAYSGQTLVNKIAEQIEAMIPLWGGTTIYSGMKRRRLAEANLVRSGGAKK